VKNFLRTFATGLALASVLFGGVASATTPVKSDRILESQDFKLHSTHPAGDFPPTPGECDWDIADGLDQAGINQLVTGVPFSPNVRQYLTSPDPVAPLISVIDVSAVAPFADPGAGDNLTYDQVTTGTGTFRLQADCDAGPALSALKSWTAQAAGTVPAKVTGAVATVISQTEITVAWSAAAGANTYKAKRGGATIASGLTSLSYPFSGLTCNTQYTFNIAGTNGVGDGPDSDPVIATTTACGQAQLDPGYPRTWNRQAMSNMSVLDVTGSQSDFNIAAGHIAKFNAGMFTGSKGTTFAGGQWHVGNYINAIKAHPNYLLAHPDGLTAFVKYTNNTQIGREGADGSPAADFVRAKARAESVGNQGTWIVTTPAGVEFGGKPTTYEMNFYDWGTSGIHAGDADSNGYRWSQWYPRYWCSGPAGADDGLENGDWTTTTGHGICEGKWDGVFHDDQSMITGQGADVNNKDQDGDADVSNANGNDSMHDVQTQAARAEGFAESVLTWRNDIFPHHPDATLKYVTGNITAIALQTDIWPLVMRGLYNGGLVEEWTGKSKGQGWGDFTTHDCATCNPPQLYSGMRGNYRRTRENTLDPRVTAFGHENGTPIAGGSYQSEFRSKWGCQQGDIEPICVADKNLGWICEDGTCSTVNARCSGTGCKWPGDPDSIDDFRLADWATAAVTVLGDGYVSINQNSPTWDSGIPWYDSWQGGSQINQVGWLGQPVESAKGDPQLESCGPECDGVHIRYFQNGVVIMNPPRRTPNVVQTKTVPLDAAGAGKRWKRLCATGINGADNVGGFSTDGRPGTPNWSGTQNKTVNTGAWVGAENTATSISIKEFQGIFLWRAPAGTTLACP
jgi:hypothetical protein